MWLHFRSADAHDARLVERQLDELQRLKSWTMAGIGTAIVIGIATIIVHGGTQTAGVAAFGAALGVGGVLGFLFGVPSPSRNHGSNGNGPPSPTPVGSGTAPLSVTAPASDQQAANSASSSASPESSASLAVSSSTPVAPSESESIPVPSASSTPTGQDSASTIAPVAATASAVPALIATSDSTVSNLEQVADWVTKLLLGGGLTQLQRIPPKIWQWSGIVAVGLDPTVTGPAAVAQQAFAAGLLVYGFVLGFFAGFLITKLQLGKALI
jgi:hypothetical protein